MSRLTETRRALQRVYALIDQQILNKATNSKDLEKSRVIVEIAFYILAFGQFEYLVKREAKKIMNENAALNTRDAVAWRIIQEKGDVSLRKMLEMIYHADKNKLVSLNSSYTIRNDSVHNNQILPKDLKDVVSFIKHLEDLAANLDK